MSPSEPSKVLGRWSRSCGEEVREYTQLSGISTVMICSRYAYASLSPFPHQLMQQLACNDAVISSRSKPCERVSSVSVNGFIA